MDKHLTDRQEEALREIGTGKTAAQVGAALGITPRTAKAHSDVLRRYFGVKTARELIAVSQDYFSERKAA